MSSFWTYLKARLGLTTLDEEGQTLVEYVLIIVLIALAVLLAQPQLAKALYKAFQNISSAVLSPPPSAT